MEKLDEVIVRTPFDLEAAISSLRFYYSVHRHNQDPIVMELWGNPHAPLQGLGLQAESPTLPPTGGQKPPVHRRGA